MRWSSGVRRFDAVVAESLDAIADRARARGGSRPARPARAARRSRRRHQGRRVPRIASPEVAAQVEARLALYRELVPRIERLGVAELGTSDTAREHHPPAWPRAGCSRWRCSAGCAAQSRSTARRRPRVDPGRPRIWRATRPTLAESERARETGCRVHRCAKDLRVERADRHCAAHQSGDAGRLGTCPAGGDRRWPGGGHVLSPSRSSGDRRASRTYRCRIPTTVVSRRRLHRRHAASSSRRSAWSGCCSTSAAAAPWWTPRRRRPWRRPSVSTPSTSRSSSTSRAISTR